jgi:hypothetical protein
VRDGHAQVAACYLGPVLAALPQDQYSLAAAKKEQIQALDRTAPMLPLQPGPPARQIFDYQRNGTTTLFAALVATGRITADACYPQHRHQEFLRFLKKVAAAHPAVELHIVAGNYAAHKHPAVKAWLKDSHRRDRSVHRRLQRPLPALHLDQGRRRTAGENQAATIRP